MGRAQRLCPRLRKLALVAPGASTLMSNSAPSAKKRGWQWGLLTTVMSKLAGFCPLARNRERSYRLMGRLVTTSVMGPLPITAVGPAYQASPCDSLVTWPSESKRTLPVTRTGLKRGSREPPVAP